MWNYRAGFLKILWLWPWGALALAMTAILASGPAGGAWMAYQRPFVMRGEIWRIFTSHLVHTGWNHLVLNLVGLGLVFGLFGPLFSRAVWIKGTLFLMAAISLCQLALDPALTRYVGFSGVLHGLLAMGGVGAIIRKQGMGWACLVGVGGKILVEQCFGPSLQTERLIHSPIYIDAHLYGAVIGGGIAVLQIFIRDRLEKKPPANP